MIHADVHAADVHAADDDAVAVGTLDSNRVDSAAVDFDVPDCRYACNVLFRIGSKSYETDGFSSRSKWLVRV